MGVWGTAIFSDDLASDIRGDYRDALGEGLSGPEATKRILKDYESSLSDQDDSPVLWLALAAVQWKAGRLEPEVLEKALQVIDSGSDLKRWTIGTKDYTKRKAALRKLREELLSPQPKAKKVAKRTLCECPWKVGDLLAYSLLSGNFVVFQLIDTHTDKGGTYPVCVLLD